MKKLRDNRATFRPWRQSEFAYGRGGIVRYTKVRGGKFFYSRCVFIPREGEEEIIIFAVRRDGLVVWGAQHENLTKFFRKLLCGPSWEKYDSTQPYNTYNIKRRVMWNKFINRINQYGPRKNFAAP